MTAAATAGADNAANGSDKGAVATAGAMGRAGRPASKLRKASCCSSWSDHAEKGQGKQASQEQSRCEMNTTFDGKATLTKDAYTHTFLQNSHGRIDIVNRLALCCHLGLGLRHGSALGTLVVFKLILDFFLLAILLCALIVTGSRPCSGSRCLDTSRLDDAGASGRRSGAGGFASRRCGRFGTGFGECIGRRRERARRPNRRGR